MCTRNHQFLRICKAAEFGWHISNPAAICPAVERNFEESAGLYTSSTCRASVILAILEAMRMDFMLIIMKTKSMNSCFKESNVEVIGVPNFQILDKFISDAERTRCAKKCDSSCLRAMFSYDLCGNNK
jgi:hypothetical protein